MATHSSVLAWRIPGTAEPGGLPSMGSHRVGHAAFDVAPAMEKTVVGKPIYPISQLESFCRSHKVLMGIITVPQAHAQQVCDLLIDCGIKAIWNFAPVHLDVPEHILVQSENMANSLAVLSMHLRAQMKDTLGCFWQNCKWLHGWHIDLMCTYRAHSPRADLLRNRAHTSGQ